MQTKLQLNTSSLSVAKGDQAELERIGLSVEPNFISPEQEKAILLRLEKEPWSDDLKRKTIQYGYRYNYETKKLEQLERQLPEWLIVLPGLQHFDQLIVNNYEKGQGISKHTDHRSYFKNEIAVVSLLSDCEIEFARKGHPSMKLLVPRRSKLTMKDELRYEWTHEIKRVKNKRISLTFRSVRKESLPEFA